MEAEIKNIFRNLGYFRPEANISFMLKIGFAYFNLSFFRNQKQNTSEVFFLAIT